VVFPQCTTAKLEADHSPPTECQCMILFYTSTPNAFVMQRLIKHCPCYVLCENYQSYNNFFINFIIWKGVLQSLWKAFLLTLTFCHHFSYSACGFNTVMFIYQVSYKWHHWCLEANDNLQIYFTLPNILTYCFPLTQITLLFDWSLSYTGCFTTLGHNCRRW
jgi:hypothetical protein